MGAHFDWSFRARWSIDPLASFNILRIAGCSQELAAFAKRRHIP